MSNYASKISDMMGTALAIVDIVTEAAADNAKSAGNIMGNEIAIKRLCAERAKLVYQLGEDVVANNEINHALVDRIQDLDKEIEERKKARDEEKE